jgi:hypothetical protein
MRKGFTSIEVLVIGFLFLIFVFILSFPLWIRLQSLGRGTHTGFVTAVDQRGYIWRNYEVYFKTDNSSSQEDVYCVHRVKQDLVDVLRGFAMTGKKVTIIYQGVRGIGFGLCSRTEIKGWSIN